MRHTYIGLSYVALFRYFRQTKRSAFRPQFVCASISYFERCFGGYYFFSIPLYYYTFKTPEMGRKIRVMDVKILLRGGLGLFSSEVAHIFLSVQSFDYDKLVQAVAQILIAIATIISLFKKARNGKS